MSVPRASVDVCAEEKQRSLRATCVQKQEIPESPQIKEEPEEQSEVKQEEEQLPVSVSFCVKKEDSPKADNVQTETGHSEHSEDTDNDDDWEPSSGSASKSTGLFPKYKSAAETSASVNDQDTTEPERGAERNKWECPFCQKRFKRKDYLQKHQLVHTGERPYSCLVCKKTFTQKGHLKTHLRSHTGAECSVCSQRFMSKMNLKRHYRTRAEERPYICSVCAKTFPIISALNSHTRTHTGNLTFSCLICRMEFQDSSSLEEHLKTHAEEKPSSCSRPSGCSPSSLSERATAESEEELCGSTEEKQRKRRLLDSDLGKPSLSRAEQLLKAMTENSEVEDGSGEEDDDPAVDEVVPQDVSFVDEEPDSSQQDSPGGDSDGAAENSASENESDPEEQRRGRKGPRFEEDGLYEDEDRLGEPWMSATFRPNLVQFQAEEDEMRSGRTGWQPLEYVEQYIDSELMKLITDCTNTMSLVNSGTSLKTSVAEMYHFFGAAILMSCVPYPHIRMFWSNPLRIPAISDTIPRDRFFKLRSHLKVVVDHDVQEDERKTDKFWKVRPFLNRVLAGCRLQARPQFVSVEEQMIPFTGACPYKQHVPLKPSQMGMKNFVLVSADGLVLDFEVYQGKQTLASQVQDSDRLKLRTLVMKRLSETVTADTPVYCDRFFNIKPADHTLREPICRTGTVKDRVKRTMKKPRKGKTMKHQGEQREDSCQQRTEKTKHVTVTRHKYSSEMERADVSDRMMSFYRTSVQTKKWTIRMLMHFTDLALANSWLLYRRDHLENGSSRKAIMKFLEFRMAVAQLFLTKCDVLHEVVHVAEEKLENEHFPPPGKRSRVAPIPHISVRSSSAHLPEMMALKNSMRCRAHGCTGKSRVRCMTCKVHLCLQTERNCFAAFHTGL